MIEDLDLHTTKSAELGGEVAAILHLDDDVFIGLWNLQQPHDVT